MSRAERKLFSSSVVNVMPGSNLNGLLESFDVTNPAAGRPALPVAALYSRLGTHLLVLVVAQYESEVSRTR